MFCQITCTQRYIVVKTEQYENDFNSFELWNFIWYYTSPYSQPLCKEPTNFAFCKLFCEVKVLSTLYGLQILKSHYVWLLAQPPYT